MDIIFFGDSLTFGYGLHNNDRFVNILKSALNLNILNKGVNGDTSTGLLSRINKDVISYKPNYCSLMIGTNDFMCNKSVNDVYDNINLLIKELLTNHIIPIICSPPATNVSLAQKLWSSDVDYSIVNTKLSKLSTLLEEKCISENLTFINFYSLIKMTDENMYTDGIHLSTYANNLMSDLWLKKFNNLKKS